MRKGESAVSAHVRIKFGEEVGTNGKILIICAARESEIMRTGDKGRPAMMIREDFSCVTDTFTRKKAL